MKELAARQVNINDSFWSPRLAVNAQTAIFHQWRKLEETRCIDNFRIAIGEKDGFREGFYFADSDAYKWLDAASRIFAIHPNPELAALMDGCVVIHGKTNDGKPLKFIPYFLWGNRAESQMTVWVNCS